MRYYNIQIGTPSGNTVTNMLTAQGGIYTSHPNGPSAPPDPGALNVEFQLINTGLDYTNTGSWLRIWGVSLTDIAQAHSLMPKITAGVTASPGTTVRVSAGMGKGLPLASTSEAGLLVSGTVMQAFGNWDGINQSLDLIFVGGTGLVPPALGQQAPDRNIAWNWTPGTSMATAISQALSIAYPSYKQQISISPNLKRTNLETGFYANLTQFSQYVHDASLSIMGGQNYTGVSISLHDDTFVVTDGTQAASAPAKAISFVDLIGQPTWIGFNTVQVTAVMRGDIRVGDQVSLPPGSVLTTGPGAYSNLRNGSIFQGTFTVKRIQHVGNFRQPSALAWTTVIEAQGPATLPSPGSISTQ